MENVYKEMVGEMCGEVGLKFNPEGEEEARFEASCSRLQLNDLLQGAYFQGDVTVFLSEQRVKQILDQLQLSSEFKLNLFTELDMLFMAYWSELRLSQLGSLLAMSETLKEKGLDLVLLSDQLEQPNSQPQSAEGYIFWESNDWVVMRKVSSQWFLLDPRRSDAEQLSELYLALLVRQRQISGDPIFLVKGDFPAAYQPDPLLDPSLSLEDYVSAISELVKDFEVEECELLLAMLLSEEQGAGSGAGGASTSGVAAPPSAPPCELLSGTAAPEAVCEEQPAAGLPGTASLPSLPGTASLSSLQGEASLSSLQGAASLSSLQGAASLSSLQGEASLSSLQGAAALSSLQGAASLSSLQGAASLPSLPGTASLPSLQREAFLSSLQGAAALSSTTHSGSVGGESPGPGRDSPTCEAEESAAARGPSPRDSGTQGTPSPGPPKPPATPPPPSTPLHTEETQQKTTNAGKEAECCVCMSERADHVVVPCGHVILCSSCAAQVSHSRASNKCPLCKTVFSCIIKVYL